MLSLPMETSLFHICLIIIFASILLPTYSKKHAALFIFGDSLFDVGANNYINTTEISRANYYPYGETFFKYPSGRFSDGRVIPDFIAEYAGLPLLPTYLFPGNDNFVYGVNFASGGAGALMETYPGYVIPLKIQLKQFENVTKVLKHKLSDEKAKELISNAVYLFHIGGNDYNAAFTSGSTLLSTTSRESYINQVVGNLTDVLKGIYKQGGRKFGIFGLGPVGCLPSARNNVTGACSHTFNEIALFHNKVLSGALKDLQNILNEFKYSFFDNYKSAMETIKHPLNYGFKEGKIACCGSGPYRGIHSCGKTGMKYELCNNPEEYVFFDASHPSEHMAGEISLLAWSGPPNITGPCNLKALFKL